MLYICEAAYIILVDLPWLLTVQQRPPTATMASESTRRIISQIALLKEFGRFFFLVLNKWVMHFIEHDRRSLDPYVMWWTISFLGNDEKILRKGKMFLGEKIVLTYCLWDWVKRVGLNVKVRESSFSGDWNKCKI